jgi:hypothetical protein
VDVEGHALEMVAEAGAPEKRMHLSRCSGGAG